MKLTIELPEDAGAASSLIETVSLLQENLQWVDGEPMLGIYGPDLDLSHADKWRSEFGSLIAYLVTVEYFDTNCFRIFQQVAFFADGTSRINPQFGEGKYIQANSASYGMAGCYDNEPAQGWAQGFAAILTAIVYNRKVVAVSEMTAIDDALRALRSIKSSTVVFELDPALELLPE